MVVRNSSMSYLQDLGTTYVPDLFRSLVYVGSWTILAGPNSTFYKYGTIAKNLLDPKTQPQNTHRNQNEPTATVPSTGSALSPWQHLPRTQILVPPIPIGQEQAHGVGFALSTIGSLVWVAKKRPIKKQRDGQGLGLRWLLFNNEKHQSTSSQRPRWDG